MELLSIEHINEKYLFYDDQRSVKKWLKERDLTILKMGKQYFVIEEKFNELINKMTNSDNATQKVKGGFVTNPLEDYEDIYRDLMQQI